MKINQSSFSAFADSRIYTLQIVVEIDVAQTKILKYFCFLSVFYLRQFVNHSFSGRIIVGKFSRSALSENLCTFRFQDFFSQSVLQDVSKRKSSVSVQSYSHIEVHVKVKHFANDSTFVDQYAKERKQNKTILLGWQCLNNLHTIAS